ncbi:site-specific DNA-methyltransferase [Actinoplanes sp. TBRC 11911]|uniref:DNA methyltransferase n=1 Tax=Actinoplanes sp. TBRC 11911 TaxID=2729386 RepID=UPI00145CA2B0|nr:DNA methyltransferase [Actinoplanes sp. TBRC 11911]NMO54838.1 site-specific DNA-methyltransferase [Actinoplanes sp. TBRC 11911]
MLIHGRAAAQVPDFEDLAQKDTSSPEPGTGRGRRHGTSSTEPFDRWFRYPAGFASDYVELLLDRLQLPKSSLVLDPFAGSGVTGTSARRMGHSFYGIEAHPAVAELASLKLLPPPANPTEFLACAKDLVAAADRNSSRLQGNLGSEADLIRRSFEPSVLAKLVAVRELIESGQAQEWSLHAKWSLLSTLRDVAAVRVGWPYQNPSQERKALYSDPLARFLQRAEWISEDLSGLTLREDEPDRRLQAVHGDSTKLRSWQPLAGDLGDGCVSSPPYLNNFDYADATRLEMYFWREVDSWAELCSMIRSKMITATTQQSRVATALAATQKLVKFGDVATKIAGLTKELEKERVSRKRGKEYDRVVPDYFASISDVLTNLAANLRPGAPVVWLIGDSAPYGVFIDTPAIISALAAQVGFTAEQNVILRRRGQRWSKNTTRHTVDLSERLLLMRRN